MTETQFATMFHHTGVQGEQYNDARSTIASEPAAGVTDP